MTAEASRGPDVPPHEDLLRVMMHPHWWNEAEQRPSSALFAFAKFSAYIASLTTPDHPVRRLPEESGRFPAGSGVLSFQCGEARTLGYDARHEPENGDNSHAHVYCELNAKQRKKNFQKLLALATTRVVVKPTFGG